MARRYDSSTGQLFQMDDGARGDTIAETNLNPSSYADMTDCDSFGIENPVTAKTAGTTRSGYGQSGLRNACGHLYL